MKQNWQRAGYLTEKGKTNFIILQNLTKSAKYQIK